MKELKTFLIIIVILLVVMVSVLLFGMSKEVEKSSKEELSLRTTTSQTKR